MDQGSIRPLGGRKVLITGGTTGIGRATAQLLRAEGADVFICGRDKEDLQKALDELPGVKGLVADIGKAEDVKRLFATIDAELGELDTVISNAGVSAGSVVDTPYEEWHYAVHVNLIGTMQVCQEAVARLDASGGGSIVIVGSMSAKTRAEGGEVYVATKMGVRGFADSFGRTVAERGIYVTLLEPGLVLTDMTDKGPEENENRMTELKMIESEDIARAIAFTLAQPIGCIIPTIQVRPLMELI